MSKPGAPEPVRLKMVIAYDGRPFRGWQSQSGGRTVQDHLEAAFAKVHGSAVSVQGAGRTDAGVHALGQCAHADIERYRLEPDRWVAALNAHLPREIRVMKCSRSPGKFHARFSAKGKIYSYRIWNAAVHPPFEIGRSWHLPGTLDDAVLKTVARNLTGTHDFASFAANRGKPAKDTVRTIRDIRIRKQGSLITLTFEGDGFLYKMVRLITGSLVRCAQGRADGEWIKHLLAGEKKTSFAAPAEGLCLVRVLY
jgi:tRNA pseudouridine38-40 synthase